MAHRKKSKISLKEYFKDMDILESSTEDTVKFNPKNTLPLDIFSDLKNIYLYSKNNIIICTSIKPIMQFVYEFPEVLPPYLTPYIYVIRNVYMSTIPYIEDDKVTFEGNILCDEDIENLLFFDKKIKIYAKFNNILMVHYK